MVERIGRLDFRSWEKRPAFEMKTSEELAGCDDVEADRAFAASGPSGCTNTDASSCKEARPCNTTTIELAYKGQLQGESHYPENK